MDFKLEFLKVLLFHAKNSLIIGTLMLPYIIMITSTLALIQLVYKLSCYLCNKLCSFFEK